MSKLTYDINVKVYLDGKYVGNIKQVEPSRWFSYFPKGSKTGGEIYSTVEAVKRSLKDAS